MENGREFRTKVRLNLLNEREGGCSCKTLGIACTCGETAVELYSEIKLPEGDKSERKKQ